ncbi:MAG TPA: zf-HC2 domain-containing protein [Gemmatimonadaceae bacterium]|nr:zf-HC2 domain-containing protein [Gemmatimonadaceae bacterium]
MKPMLDCDAVMRQLWDYLDGELTPERMDAIRVHLSMCERCQPHAQFEQTFLSALARVRREPSNPAGIARRVRAALAAHGFSIA